MYRVFIVDDLEILRYDLKRMKVWGEDTGFSIEGEASDGRKALVKLRESSFDFLITDIRMPVMDGMELLQAVSREKLCPCTVLLSDYTEFAYAREGLQYGAFDYLGKPVDQNIILELLGRVKVFLDQKKLEDEKIKQLEDMADSSFFPAQQAEKVASLLITAHSTALDQVTELLESVGLALNNDNKKAAVIIENVIKTISSKLLKEHKWIESFVNINTFWPSGLSKTKSWTEIYQKVYNAFENILEFLNRFIIWRQEDGIVKKACIFVLNNPCEKANLQNVSDNLYISKAYLSELFKKETGMSLLSYISRIKMERAKHLITTTSLRNYEVSEKLGFVESEYFSKVFKKNTGVSPSIFRKNNAIEK